MNRKLILKMSKIIGGKSNRMTPNSVFRKLLDDKRDFNVPFSSSEIAMISYLSVAFNKNEDIEVLYNHIENNLFMVKFDVISEVAVDIDCDVCEGSGEYECPACNGTGEDGEEDCYNCDGKGESTCLTCGGDGYLIDEHSVLKDEVTCFSYNKDYFNMFELNTSGFITSADYDTFLEDEKTIFIIDSFGVLDQYNYQYDVEVGQSFIVDFITL